MKSPLSPFGARRAERLTVGLTVSALAWFAGCNSDNQAPAMPPPGNSGLPSMPMPMPGQATLAGHVVDSAGNGVAGAVITVAETDGSATTDAAGAYGLMVPSDSTLTLKTTATGFASSFRGSLVVADQSASTGVDIVMMTPAEVTGANALGGVAQPETRGLIGLRLHSVSDACTLTGAHVSVFPPDAAKVVYARPGAMGALDTPDTSVDGVQGGVAIAAWLVDAMPPANMLMISVDHPACALMSSPPSTNGVVFTGALRADANALTVGDLFFDQQP